MLIVLIYLPFRFSLHYKISHKSQNLQSEIRAKDLKSDEANKKLIKTFSGIWLLKDLLNALYIHIQP